MQLDAMGLDRLPDKLFQSKPLRTIDVRSNCPLLEIEKGDGKEKAFTRAAWRNAAAVIELLGDRPISDYASSEAGQLRDVLLQKGLAVTSIKQIFGSIKAIVDLAMAEHGIEGRNPFASIHMPYEKPSSRQPISLADIRHLQQACMVTDDENRWLLALIGDTGLRLSEAVGLAKDDIMLDAPTPYANLQPHSWRRLKTKSSERLVPLIGASLWASERLMQNDSSLAFPSYCNGKTCNITQPVLL